MSKLVGFYAYASSPNEVGETIERGTQSANRFSIDTEIKTWRSLDIPGHFISEQVLLGIDEADFLIADISTLNFNVTYEVGYAIGKNKRVLLTRNSSIRETYPTIKDVGIFDTLGYSQYQNSTELARLLVSAHKDSPLETNFKKTPKLQYSY